MSTYITTSFGVLPELQAIYIYIYEATCSNTKYTLIALAISAGRVCYMAQPKCVCCQTLSRGDTLRRSNLTLSSHHGRAERGSIWNILLSCFRSNARVAHSTLSSTTTTMRCAPARNGFVKDDSQATDIYPPPTRKHIKRKGLSSIAGRQMDVYFVGPYTAPTL